ncbi:hypothetical protein ACI3L1_19640, partial [Deinococcus sp. SM5_A1]|uniref:hypothetical protein n=1 Tax=Deinococcus sp. SM5_A1 TaxID=3379094 RepID=UPI00385F3307
MKNRTLHLGLGLCAALALGSALAVTGPSQEELNNADNATDSWLMYNKGYKPVVRVEIQRLKEARCILKASSPV